jgi:hypothetical protein
VGSRRLTLDETLLQPAEAPQALLESSHFAGVTLVIIAKKVQQAVQGKHPKLGGQAVPCGPRLPARHAVRNDDIPQLTRLIRGK